MRAEPTTHGMMSSSQLDESDSGQFESKIDVSMPDLAAFEQPTARNRLHRALDFALAATALTLFSPLILLVAVAIKLDSRGPVFYRQLRIGLDRRGGRPREGDDNPLAPSRRTADLGGSPFTIYKFRTMELDAEDQTGPVWASPQDERVTRIGRFLRPYRLDEIPQFLNVIRGEMSIVGPRPERPSFVHVLRSELEEYPLRHRVPPGITGWAQVNQEPDQTLDDVRQKLAYDLEYLRRRSLSFDLRIMFQTVPVILERWSSRK